MRDFACASFIPTKPSPTKLQRTNSAHISSRDRLLFHVEMSEEYGAFPLSPNSQNFPTFADILMNLVEGLRNLVKLSIVALRLLAELFKDLARTPWTFAAADDKLQPPAEAPADHQPTIATEQTSNPKTAKLGANNDNSSSPKRKEREEEVCFWVVALLDLFNTSPILQALALIAEMLTDDQTQMSSDYEQIGNIDTAMLPSPE